jgi:uncharacterized membrane protein YeiH
VKDGGVCVKSRFATAHPLLSRIGRPIDVLDAAGLAVFCVTGASTALDHGLAAAPAVILGAITGIGGGILRDILVRQIPSCFERDRQPCPVGWTWRMRA